MKKYCLLIALSITMTYSTTHPIKVFIKGGDCNQMALAIFKNSSQFKNFLHFIGVSSKVADSIAQNAPKFGKVAGKIAGIGVGIATEETGFGPVFGVMAKHGVELWASGIGKLASLSKGPTRKAAENKLTNLYWGSLNANSNNTKCKPITGSQHGLIYKRNVPPVKNKYLTIKDPKPLYVVILNKETIKDSNGTIIAKPYDVMFADYLTPKKVNNVYLPSEGPFGSYSITTKIGVSYEADDTGKPIIKDGKPVVAKRTLGAILKMIDPVGGIECPNTK